MLPLACDTGKYHQANRRFFTLHSSAIHLSKVKEKFQVSVSLLLKLFEN